jgi:hypothetical protein
MAKTMRVKRDEAMLRQLKYDAMSTEQKIAKLDQYGFKAVKERARLATKKEDK